MGSETPGESGPMQIHWIKYQGHETEHQAAPEPGDRHYFRKGRVRLEDASHGQCIFGESILSQLFPVTGHSISCPS